MNSSHQTIRQFSHLRLIGVLATVAALLMVVNVFMSARVAQDGLAVDELAKQEAQLKTEIAGLEQQLLSVTSLQDLAVKAEQLGYRQPETVISLTASNRIAQF